MSQLLSGVGNVPSGTSSRSSMPAGMEDCGNAVKLCLCVCTGYVLFHNSIFENSSSDNFHVWCLSERLVAQIQCCEPLRGADAVTCRNCACCKR